MADLRTISPATTVLSGRSTTRRMVTKTVDASQTLGAQSSLGPDDADTLGNDSSIDPYGSGNDIEAGVDMGVNATDSVGNTIFYICIAAVLITALGLGLVLWRKHKKMKALNGGQAMINKVDAQAESSIAGMFKTRQKGRPSPLPLSGGRASNDPTLPPYSPYAAPPGQSPWLSESYSMQAAQAERAADLSRSSSARTSANVKALAKLRRDAAERSGAPFSPFLPFSPVTTTRPIQPTVESVQREEDVVADLTAAYRSRPDHLAIDMPQPSPVRYMDPEAAQAMGIHPDVVKKAERGISEDEIERRRANAQRRLEEQQRAEEGAVLEEPAIVNQARFSSIAADRQL